MTNPPRSSRRPSAPWSRDMSATEQKTLIGIGVGVAAAAIGTAAGLAAERFRRRAVMEEPASAPNTPNTPNAATEPPREVVKVPTAYGTPLHAEIQQPPSWQPGDVTLVFCHGYALSQQSWHFQREFFANTHRMVFWDQRGHGLSEHCSEDPTTIDVLGDDLAAVIRTTTPTGPVVLVGHSMGGMTVMAYTERHHHEFAHRVAGVALIATTAGALQNHDFGWGIAAPVLHTAAPALLNSVAKFSKYTEKYRKGIRAVESTLVKRYSYSSAPSKEVADLTPAMIAATSLEVLNDFLPAFKEHDKANALGLLEGIETLVLVGDNDLMTPPEHSERIVQLVPHAWFVRVPQAGHMVMLEYPDLVNEHLNELIEAAGRTVIQLPDTTPAPDTTIRLDPESTQASTSSEHN